MLHMALAALRNRKGAAVGGLLALFFAAAMVCACGVLLETGLRGPIAPGRFAGTPVVVAGDQQLHWVETKHKHGKTKRKVKSKDLAERVWLPASIGTRLGTVPGATVVSDRTFTAELFRPGGRFVDAAGGRPIFGHDWSAARLTPYRIVSGRAPGGDGQVVLDSGLAAQTGLGVGDRIGVQSTGSPATFTVAGIVQAQSPVTQESALFFSESEAATLAAHGDSVTAYGVFGASADAVRDALRGTTAKVVTGNDRGAAALPGLAAARTRLVSMSGAIGGTALIVALLVVVGTFTLSIQQRHRELALLRAIGATPRQVRRLISREALVLGLLAGVCGAVAGLPLASLIRRKFVSYGAVPDAIGLAHSPFPVLAGLLVTLLAALLASRISARRITRIRPAEALSEASVERRTIARGRTIAGVLATAGAVSVSLLLTALHTEPAALPVTYLCVLLWTIGIALLGPFLARAGVAVLSIAWRASPVGGFLAAKNAQLYSRRAASVITPLALLIAMTATILFVPTTLDAAVRAQTRDGLSADWVLGSSGPGVPAAAVARVRSTPGVAAAVSAVESTIWVGRDKRSAQGVSSPGLTQVIDPDLSAGSLAHLDAGDIAMSTLAAHGRHPGDRVDATLGDGTKASFTLVAIYRRGLGFGDVLMNFDQLAQHVDTPLAQQVFVKGSADSRVLRDELAAYPGLTLIDRSGYRQVLTHRQHANDAANLVFLALIIAFCGIAVVNTLAMATTDRSREFSLLRLTGATARQVRSMLRWELALVAVLAVGLAAIASGATLTGFSIGLTSRTMPTIEPLTYAGLVLGAVLLASVALNVSARALLRRHPADDMTSGP
jgi:putative ABC transport system permease protein